MKKLIFVVLFLLMIPAIGWSDVFTPKTSNADALSASIKQDTSGYYYSGAGYDYNIKAPPDTIINAGAKDNFKFGCSGYDFNTSFLKSFNTEALSSTVTNQSSQIMAAAPLLLLNYASPSIADAIKHFTNLANAKLSTDVMRCQELETAVGDKFDKLRKASERECLEQNKGMGLTGAMEFCKKQADPFSFLKDINGTSLQAGGRINVVEEALKRIQVPDEEAKKTLAITGDTVITKGGYEDNGQVKTYEKQIEESRDKNMSDFIDLVNNYKVNRTISDAELEKFSRPGVPITKRFLDNLLVIDEKQRVMLMAKLSSYWAVLDTNQQYRTVIEQFNAALTNSKTQEEVKEVLRDKRDKVAYELSKAKDHYEELARLKDIIAQANSDADSSRGQLIQNVDGTPRSGDAQARENRSKDLLLGF